MSNIFYLKLQILNKSILFLSIILSTTLSAQENSKSSNIWGGVIEDCYVGELTKQFGLSSFSCNIESKYKLFKNQLVIITDFKKCGNNTFFEIYFKGNPVMIDSEKLLVTERNQTISFFNNANDDIKKEIRLRAEKSSLEWFDLELKKANELFEKAKKNGIVITRNQIFSEGQYPEGTGYEVDFYNTENKTIKYVWITLNGYNSVNDYISTKTVQCIGFVESKSTGSFKFDFVWNTDLVESVKIKSIKIQYKDNTIKNISNPENSLLSEWCVFLFLSNH